MIQPLPPPRQPMSPRVERRLRAASAVFLVALLASGAWIELRALSAWAQAAIGCEAPAQVR